MSNEQPVEQKPHTMDVVAWGFNRVGTCPRPKPPGARSSSAVSAPSRRRSVFMSGSSPGRARGGEEQRTLQQLAADDQDQRDSDADGAWPRGVAVDKRRRDEHQ